MGKIEQITPALKEFISNQKIFFVGTAMRKGRINVSPKGMDSFRVINENKIIWLNLTGSGNETATHLLETPRMTIMFCSFEGKPMILRLYGDANAYHERDAEFQEHINLFPKTPGSRQIIIMHVDLVQTSCGYAVPFMDFKEERTQLKSWAEKQGDERLNDFQKKYNLTSLDGHDTKLFED